MPARDPTSIKTHAAHSHAHGRVHGHSAQASPSNTINASYPPNYWRRPANPISLYLSLSSRVQHGIAAHYNGRETLGSTITESEYRTGSKRSSWASWARHRGCRHCGCPLSLPSASIVPRPTGSQPPHAPPLLPWHSGTGGHRHKVSTTTPAKRFVKGRDRLEKFLTQVCPFVPKRVARDVF